MMHNKPAAISIIIPVYNKAPYLQGCIDSVLAQTLADFELLLIDDCSTDASLAICRDYAARDPRIRLIESKQNEGAAAARNRGLDEARGEWVGFVDADDTIDKTMYEILLSQAAVYNADVAICGCAYHDADGELRRICACAEPAPLDNDEAMIRLLSTKPWDLHLEVSQCNKLYRRSLIGDIRFCAPSGEDYLFNYQVFLNVSRAIQLPDILYHIHLYPDSNCRGELSLRMLGSLEAMRQVSKSVLELRPALIAPALGRYVEYIAGFSVAAVSTTRIPYREARRYILGHYDCAKQMLKESCDPTAKKSFHDRALDIRFPRLHDAVDWTYRAYLRVREKALRGRWRGGR